MLVDLQEDKTAWRSTGVMGGSARLPIKDFIKSATSRTETEMVNAGLLPRF